MVTREERSSSVGVGSALDEFDLAILEILQADNTTPQRLIGEQVNLSPAAVNRRIRRMEQQGVITGHAAIVDPAKVGRPISVVVEVHVESERVDLLDETKQKFLSDPEVQQCYYVTGDGDFIIFVTVASMESYEDLTRRLFFANPNVKRFRSSVVMDRIKSKLAVPVR